MGMAAGSRAESDMHFPHSPRATTNFPWCRSLTLTHSATRVGWEQRAGVETISRQMRKWRVCGLTGERVGRDWRMRPGEKEPTAGACSLQVSHFIELRYKVLMLQAPRTQIQFPSLCNAPLQLVVAMECSEIFFAIYNKNKLCTTLYNFVHKNKTTTGPIVKKSAPCLNSWKNLCYQLRHNFVKH
jgi:hypothetical protein